MLPKRGHNPNRVKKRKRTSDESEPPLPEVSAPRQRPQEEELRDFGGGDPSEGGILYVVATPIGNLGDITLRALDVLRSASLIACEDTRKSRILLNRWSIGTKLMSLHKFSESRKTAAILDILDQGADVALITDAGTPGISDPGSRVVRAAMDGGFRVVPVPGPCAVTAALSASGLEGGSFVYMGYAPRKEDQRKVFFEAIAAETRTVIFFETRARVSASLSIAAGLLGERRMIMVRELTKVHEEILVGTASSILADLQARETIRGEIILLVEGRTGSELEADPDAIVEALMKEGLSGKRLAEEAFRRFGLKKSIAYARFLDLSGLRSQS